MNSEALDQLFWADVFWLYLIKFSHKDVLKMWQTADDITVLQSDY